MYILLHITPSVGMAKSRALDDEVCTYARDPVVAERPTTAANHDADETMVRSGPSNAESPRSRAIRSLATSFVESWI